MCMNHVINSFLVRTSSFVEIWEPFVVDYLGKVALDGISTRSSKVRSCKIQHTLNEDQCFNTKYWNGNIERYAHALTLSIWPSHCLIDSAGIPNTLREIVHTILYCCARGRPWSTNDMVFNLNHLKCLASLYYFHECLCWCCTNMLNMFWRDFF